MKIVIISFVIIAFYGFTVTDELTGRWESKPSSKGNVTGILLREDHSFEGYINKKPFVSGTYSFTPEDSVFTFTDNGCNGLRGIYKIIFFNNSDSMRFVAVNDSCTERKNGMERLIMGRVKKK